MGVLDDLKKQAEEVKAKEELEKSTTLRRRELTLQAVLPTMKALYKYLKDLAEQLNVVEPEVSVSYEVRGYGKLSGLRQRDYKIATDDRQNLHKFSFSFACRRDGVHEFQKGNKELTEHQKEYLWGHNLRFKHKVTADGRGIFLLESYVPVSFDFDADFKRAAIRLRIRNLDVLGQSTYLYEPSQIDKEFMEELAKCILRKPSRFGDLSGNTLSEETRARLREQLEAQKRAGGAEAPVAEETDDVKKKGGLFTRSFKKGFFGNK